MIFLPNNDIDFNALYLKIGWLLYREGKRVDVGEWQSQRVDANPFNKTIELHGVSFDYPIAERLELLQEDIQPNLPWAEDHFQERVGGQPVNPPPSHEWWPFARKSNDEHRKEEKFDHTYPERMWPKFANEGETRPNGRQVFVPHNGIRFEYGDLNDVRDQLKNSPYTRQAFLPIWFPEDTGKTDVRVPCTLGYHFIIREGKLHVTYYMRSCDYMRHFRDDVYLACRLAQSLRGALGFLDLQMGKLTMHVVSMHIFEGPDEYNLKQLLG